MSTTPRMKTIVVGAGLGGLTSAIALRQAEFDVTVVERACELTPAGAGISLWPNAVKALESLGLGSDLRRIAAPARGTVLHRSDGRRLGRSMTDTLPARFGAPLLVAHRAELQAMLLSALGDATVLPDWPCESAAVHSSERMVVRRGDGAALEADLIVAADGIRSAVRSHLFRGEAAAEYAGYTAWRGVASLPAHLVDELDTGEFLGRGRLFGVARLPGDRAYWWASARGPAPEGPNRDALLERFAGWAKPIAALVEATPSEDIHATLLQRRAPVERMTWQRLAFVGDAAHPMLPNIGQGGCQAIEDAVVLGGLLARAGRDLPPALARYESLRARHTRQVVKASDRMAKAVHLANPLAIALRNAAFTATPPGAVARRLSPIVGYDAVAVSVAA